MKLKKAVIKIRSIEDVKARWKKALKGEIKYIQKKNEIVFLSFESAAKVFSKNRMQILQTIAQYKPDTIYELAKILNKDFKTVYTDVKYLSEMELIELQETDSSRNGLKPIALYSGIEFDWAA